MSRENQERCAETIVRRRARDIAWRRCSALAPAALVAGAALLSADTALASEDGLVLTPDLPMLLTLMALFIALIFPVNALLFRPIFAALDAREEKIAGTRARAEKLAAQAEEVLQRYQGAVREARESAEQERRNRLTTVKGEASARILGRDLS